MVKKKQTQLIPSGEAEFLDILPRITIFPGESETTFKDLRQAFILDLSPATPYETALADNLVTLEWETHRHRNIRDRLILTKLADLSVGVFQNGAIETVSRGEVEEDAFNYGNALASADPEQQAIGMSALEKTGFTPSEILAEAYRQVSGSIEVHEHKLAELELRRRRLRDDYDRLKAARAKPVEEAEVLTG